MSYTDNLLPKVQTAYSVVNTTISNGIMHIGNNGSATYSIPSSTLDKLSDDYMLRIINDNYDGDSYLYMCIITAVSQDTSSESLATYTDVFYVYPAELDGANYHFSLTYDKPLSISVTFESTSAVDVTTWELYNEVTASDVQSEIDELRESVNDANASYYFDSNSSLIHIGKGTTFDIATVHYRANPQAYIMYHGIFVLDVDFCEDISDDTYTYDDAICRVYYYLNNTLIQTQVHRFTGFVEPHLLNLMAVLRNGEATNGVLKVKLESVNSAIDINIGDGHSYVTTKNFEYKDFNIEVTTKPTKLHYYDNEQLNYNGIVVSKVYKDGTREAITQQCSFNPPNNAPVADFADFVRSSIYTLEVMCSYQELNYWGELITYTASFDVTIEQNVPEDLRISGPAKTNYKEGELWDYAGLSVSVLYTNGAILPAVDYSIYPPAGTVYNAAETQQATVTFSSNALVTLRDTIDTNWIDVTDIIIAQNPSKMAYIDGELWDYSGLVVNAVYSDGTQIDVTSLCSMSPVNGAVYVGSDTSIATISYKPGSQYPLLNTVETEYIYTESIDVTSQPHRMLYNEGDSISYDGLSVALTYSNGTSIPITNYNLSIPNGYTMPADDLTSVISYNDLTHDLMFYLADNTLDLGDLVNSGIGNNGGPGNLYKYIDYTNWGNYVELSDIFAYSAWEDGYDTLVLPDNINGTPVRFAQYVNVGGEFEASIHNINGMTPAQVVDLWTHSTEIVVPPSILSSNRYVNYRHNKSYFRFKTNGTVLSSVIPSAYYNGHITWPVSTGIPLGISFDRLLIYNAPIDNLPIGTDSLYINMAYKQVSGLDMRPVFNQNITNLPLSLNSFTFVVLHDRWFSSQSPGMVTYSATIEIPRSAKYTTITMKNASLYSTKPTIKYPIGMYVSSTNLNSGGVHVSVLMPNGWSQQPPYINEAAVNFYMSNGDVNTIHNEYPYANIFFYTQEDANNG